MINIPWKSTTANKWWVSSEFIDGPLAITNNSRGVLTWLMLVSILCFDGAVRFEGRRAIISSTNKKNNKIVMNYWRFLDL